MGSIGAIVRNGGNDGWVVPFNISDAECGETGAELLACVHKVNAKQMGVESQAENAAAQQQAITDAVAAKLTIPPKPAQI